MNDVVLSNIEKTVLSDYKYGFVTNIHADEAPKGLNEDIVRFISAKKNEPQWMLEWRLKAFHQWLKMEEPTWANVKFPPINYQDIIYYSAPKQRPSLNSVDEIDPELREHLINSVFHWTSKNASPGWPWTLWLIAFLLQLHSKSNFPN